MKTLLIASALCFLAVSGHPQPDQDLRLDAGKHDSILEGVAESLDDITTTAAPFKIPIGTKQGTTADRTRLVNDLFTNTNYNKMINPDSVKLEFGINLIDFRVREDKNAIESYVWLKYTWKDDRLTWKPDEYGGVEVLRLDSTIVWKPDVTLYNSVDPVNMVNCWESNILIYPSGSLLWVPPCKMMSHCELSLRKHPYGNQECFMKFGSWTFDGNVLDPMFYNGTKGIDISEIHNSSGYEIVSTTAEKNVRYYPCCPDPYPDLTFNVTIRRTPAEELFNRFQ